MNKSFEILVKDFNSIGIKKGDTVMVHSSLSSMGNVDGGELTVIDALKEVIGEEGTLLFPAFTFSTSYYDNYFSYKNTPSCVGKISETFRNLDGVVRSFHPTHSVSASGKYAIEITKDHYLDDTPVGANSPLRKLPKYNGKILILGCTFAANTFMHGMEELAEVFYVSRGYQEYTMVDKDGKESKKQVCRNNFARPEGRLIQHYERALDVLEENVDYKLYDIHGAKSVLISSVALEEKAVKKMKEVPTYFIEDPDKVLK